MSENQAARVFDRFYRGDSARLDGGSGLGLFIVARLAHTFGGRVGVDTEVGKGSTFRVVLPLFPDGGDPGMVDGAGHRAGEPRSRGKKRDDAPGE